MAKLDGPMVEAERLLPTLTDDEIVLRTGVSLEEVVFLRATRAAAPFPPVLKAAIKTDPAA